MIGFVKGQLISINNYIATIEVNGFGLNIIVSNNTLEKIKNIKDEVKLFTYLNVREDGISLFGFFLEEEKRMFMNLITITGIGPKAAITILSGLSLNSLALAIISQDIKALSKIKGVGKKTAERIVLELKEIISKEHIGLKEEVNFSDSASSDMFDAIEALCSLGIQRSDAVIAINKVKGISNTIEELIINSLKSLN